MLKPRQTVFPEKRLRHRARIAKMLRVRPSSGSDFEEVVVSKNVTKDSIYFHTHRNDYRKNMRLFITFPLSEDSEHIKTDYLAEVLRVETLGEYRFGVAVRLIGTV
jgi:hypothetical protein